MKNKMKNEKLAIFFTAMIVLFSITDLFSQDSNLGDKIRNNDIKAVKEMIASGIDINRQNERNGYTPLMIAACLRNHEEMAKLLISEGADVNAKKVNGTGVFTQCINGVLWKSVTLELAEILLSRGVDIDEARTSGGSQGFTNLIMAVDSNNEEVVRFLIKNGANVNAKTRDGDTALSLAVKKGYQNIINILKSNGAK